MEQTANSLGATSAYDLACRYNNLFQYSPAAAAACAAAYGIFGNSAGKSMGSSSSPFQPLGTIATSSLPSSSSSNLTSSPTSSLSSLVSNNSKQEAGRTAQTNVAEEKCEPIVDECMDTKSKTNNSYENVSDNDASMSDENDSDDDEQNLSSLSECAPADDQQKAVDINKMQQKLNAETEKSIASCMDNIEDEHSIVVGLDENKKESEQNETEENVCSATSKRGCAALEEHSIGSLMNTLVNRDNNQQPNPTTTTSTSTTNTNMKFIGSNELDALRKNLIDSVSQAIQNTLDTFCKSIKQQHHLHSTNVTSNSMMANNSADLGGDACVKQEQKIYNDQSCDQTRMAPAPKRIRVNEKIAKNSSSSASSSSSLSSNNINNNSQNFNVSKILSKDTHINSNNNNNNTFKRKFSTNGLLSHQTDSFGPFNPSSLMHSSKPFAINPNQSLLSTSNLNNKQQHLSSFYSAMSQLQPYATTTNNNNNGNVMHPNFASNAGLGGVSSAPSANSVNPISSLFAAHQHHLLMAAAQAAAASNPTGQNSNYLQMAAAANRLFTPYLIDQQASQPKANGQLIPSVSNHHTPMFNSPHKRRRTKVTDTRLSPRNPFVHRTGHKARDDSPNNNDEDDQHDNNNDYEDEHQNNNQEDDSASSGCNESGSTTGSNCRITNGYSNQYDLANDNTNDHYTGYQISFYLILF